MPQINEIKCEHCGALHWYDDYCGCEEDQLNKQVINLFESLLGRNDQLPTMKSIDELLNKFRDFN